MILGRSTRRVRHLCRATNTLPVVDHNNDGESDFNDIVMINSLQIAMAAVVSSGRLGWVSWTSLTRIHRLFFVLMEVIVAAPGTGDLFKKVPKIGKEYRTQTVPNSVSYCQ